MENEPRIRFSCSRCGAEFAVPPHLAGRRAICKRCRGPIVVPRPGSETPPQVRGAPGPTRRRRSPVVVALAAAVAALAAIWAGLTVTGVLGDAAIAQALARAAATDEAVLQGVTGAGEPDWMSAAHRTREIVAALEAVREPNGPEALDRFLEQLRLQTEWLEAAARLQRQRRDLHAGLEHYRRSLWHPPAAPGQMTDYLARMAALRRSLIRQAREISAASADAGESLSALITLEQSAAALLQAQGIAVRPLVRENETRLRALLGDPDGAADFDPDAL